MKNKDFTHLHVHSGKGSNLRLLDSINKVEDMVNYIDSIGGDSLAITDHESLSSHVDLLKYVKKFNKDNNKNFKPILGNEIYLVNEEELNTGIERDRTAQFYHFLLIAKDTKGHEQLRKLSSRAWERMFNFKGMDRVPTFYSDFDEVVGNDRGHLIGSTACLGGYFAKKVVQLEMELDEYKKEDIRDEIHGFLSWGMDTFNDDFYIEIQPSLMDEQISFNKKAIDIAKAYGIKYIVTTDAHYLRIEDREIHEAFLTSSEDDSGSREVGDFYSSTHFFEVEELFKAMNYLDKEVLESAILNTKYIKECVSEYSLFKSPKIPLTPLENEEKWFNNEKIFKLASKYKNIKYMMQDKENKYNAFLVDLALKGMGKKIQTNEYNEVLARMDIECKEIIGISHAKEQPVAGYFTTMKKNIDVIWDEAEAIVPAGRGSAGAYIINYLIGITQVNPLKQGVELPHFRFISAERPDYPDIDIDIPSHKRNRAFNELKKYYNSIGGDIIRVCTFGTETAKSAIQTSCRGLKINGDVAMYLSSLIPVERGQVRNIKTCYYGDEKENIKPITEFKNLIDEWSEKTGKNLLKIALGIEGLVNKRSSHPCGAIITNEAFTNRNALMRTPSGELVTQFDLHDSEELGGIKYDLLNTSTASMIQITLELLLKNNKIQWQGSLRKTYDKYLHPDVIERDSEDMWRLLTDGMLISAFQYDSPVGEQAIKSIQPTNFMEAMNGNNLMRLMAEEGKQQPMDIYVRNKLDMSKWEAEMNLNGLNEREKQIIKNHLNQDYGVCSTQERMMLMSMDKNISGFNVVESNILRKGVAKKVGDVFEKAHKLFYERGLANGSRKEFLDYIWNIQIAMQRGYGFSVVHSVEYTWILTQQLNLIKYYPPIYWNTAVLLIESGAIDLEETENSDIKSKEKGTKYGAMASAISNLQDKGVVISLPNINEAEKGFVPNEEKNEIMFGLKGITGVNSDIIDEIMKHRPFSSVDDFYNRMLLVKKEVIDSKGATKQKSLATFSSLVSLIKAGAFDGVIKSREEELRKAILLKSPNKQKLEMRESTVDKIIELGIIPNNLKEYLRFYNFNKYIKTLPIVKDKKSKSIKWIKIDCGDDEDTDYTTNFLLENFIYDMREGENEGYYTDEYGFINVAIGTSKIGSYNKAYNSKMKPFFDWYKSKECLDIYNNHNFEMAKDKYMNGNQSKWEMDSMNFYYGKHELWNLNKEFYEVEDFNSLAEEPTVVGFTKYNGMSYPKFELTRIAGTVLDRDKNRHTVTLLTPTGVVNVKFYSGQFSFYDKTVSIYDSEKDKKTTLEEGWFSRGTKLLITGFRRGDQFKPKKYKNSIYQHSLQKIDSIDENGMLSLTSDRAKGD